MRHMTLKVIVGFDDSITYYLLIWDTCFKMNFLFCLSMTRLRPCCTGPRRGQESPRFGGTPFFVAFFTIFTSTSLTPNFTAMAFPRDSPDLEKEMFLSSSESAGPISESGSWLLTLFDFCFIHIVCIKSVFLQYWMMPLESSQWITSIGIKSVCRFRLLRA